jgi:uncharacterized membrane protein
MSVSRSVSRERVLVALLFINLWLQVFDGFATYVGVSAGYGEGNPLVAATFAHLGLGPALCLAKASACLCIVLIWSLGPRSALAMPALVGTAITYVIASVAPWSVAFAGL